YGISGYDGSGQTVAIIDAYASPTIQQDLDQWSANRGLPSTKITQVVAPGTYHHPEAGLKQDPQGWYGEETLDVEAVHGMAPGAKIVYVGAPNNFQDLDAAMVHVVDARLAQIVTNSYGFNTELLPSGFIKPFESILIQAAAQGIGVYFSSGDNSDESVVQGYITTDWPASSPWVTAVGGTSIAIGANNTYQFETGWGTRRSRWTDALGNFCNGATSLSSPIMAGIMALADQARGSPHGFANPALYAIAGSSAVRDVTTPRSIVAAVRTDYCDFLTAASGIFYSLLTMNQDLSLS